MIKAKIGDGNILLGLSDENIKRLKQDLPIMVDLKELGMKGKIFIVHGATEQAIIAKLRKEGLFGSDTKINETD